MKRDAGTCRILEHGLLRVYKQAAGEQRWEVAEHLLRALEELAKSEPACQSTVVRAYLGIPHVPSLDPGRPPRRLRNAKHRD